MQDPVQIDAGDYKQLDSIFVTINVNRTFSPAWMVAGCHVPYPSAHARCIYPLLQKHSENRVSCQGCAFAHQGLRGILFLRTPSQIHSKPVQVHMTL